MKKASKILNDLNDAQASLEEALTKAKESASFAKDDILSLEDDLQEKFDEMSDTAKEGEKGEELDGEIEKLRSLEEEIDACKAELGDYSPFADAISSLKEIVES